MEERLPSSDETNNKLPPPPDAAPLETYVVQIPRDQIYRVPPPEHARIVEEHQRNTSNQKANNRRSFLRSYAIPIAVITVIAVVAVLVIRSTAYRPATPQFAVTHIQGKHLGQHLHGNHQSPEFTITIQANNPNTRMSVSYHGGGEAALVFKDTKIGEGKIPSTIKDDDSAAATDFAVALAGDGAALSTEIKKSLNDDKEKSMKLKIELPVEMNSWVRNESMNVKISCDFRVHNSLMNNTKISFQECTTEM